MGGLSLEEGLTLAAEDHIADIGETGTASHSSSDGTTAAAHLSKSRLKSKHDGGECYSYTAWMMDLIAKERQNSGIT